MTLPGMAPVACVAFALTILTPQWMHSIERYAATGARQGATTMEFSVAGMSCAGCAESAKELLKKIPGVRKAGVDFDSKKAVLRIDGEVRRDDVRRALGELGFEARFPGEVVLPPLTEEEKKGLDIGIASRGEAFAIKDKLAPGKITIFDYFADWCGPCHLLTPKLERLLLQYPDLALRKVDISNWETAAARQATRDFKMPGLPYVRIYGADGRFLGAVKGNHVEQVREIIQRSRSK